MSCTRAGVPLPIYEGLAHETTRHCSPLDSFNSGTPTAIKLCFVMAKIRSFKVFLFALPFLVLFSRFLYHANGCPRTITTEDVPVREDKIIEPILTPPTRPEGQENHAHMKSDPVKVEGAPGWNRTGSQLISLEWRERLVALKNDTDTDTTEKVPGQDKALGFIVTHTSHPECREHIVVTGSDPEILVSVKTARKNHKYRLSLQLFTWMKTINPDQVKCHTCIQYSQACIVSECLFVVV